ncbi:MAG: hypothetical protein K9M07_06570 [Simkaniaceae bacterium]|nr:hypothetical protein [Simkaniaceae bacterium]MCF7852887.1 hypothetical protein [Simkaniaceae bacterium]
MQMHKNHTFWKMGLGAILFSFIISGCHRQNQTEQTLYHDDGRCKSKVAFFNLVDHSKSNLPWDLSEEMTVEISKKLRQDDLTFLIPEDQIAWEYPLQTEPLNPFKDHHWLIENHPDAEFIVFTELVEHDIVASNPDQDATQKTSYRLNLSTRVKVIDLRDDIPKVILQEIISQSQFIPWQFAGIDYNKTQWGKVMFTMTPIGLAHNRMIKTVAKRVQDYVLLAKSKS